MESSQTPLQSHTVKSKHSLCNPEPKLTQDKADKQKGQKGIAPIPFLNPDPVVQFVGCTNKAPVVVDGCEVTALVDSGAQVLNISTQLCAELGLKIQPLGQLLELEGTGGAAIPYLGFVEVNLQILGIRRYNEGVLLLAIPTMAYAERVLVVVGSKIIHKALGCMTVGELAKVTVTWWQAHFGAVMSGHCSYPTAAQRNWQCKTYPGKVTLWRCRSTSWMVLKVLFTPHRRSQCPHFKP